MLGDGGLGGLSAPWPRRCPHPSPLPPSGRGDVLLWELCTWVAIMPFTHPSARNAKQGPAVRKTFEGYIGVGANR